MEPRGPDFSISNSSSDLTKEEQFLGDAGQAQARTISESPATLAALAALTPEHREYLQRRHGTVDLDPIPEFTDADPYNWPQWKKVANLVLVAFHATMTTMTAGSLIPAFGEIAEDLHKTTTDTTYLTTLQIAITGVGPFIWKPLSSRYGRRPIFLCSLFCSLIGNVGCGLSHSFKAMAICRAIVAFFISPAGAIGSAVVAETFFKHERHRYMGIWTLMVCMGVSIGPFIFGFVTNDCGYRWIFWILAMTNGGQFVLYLFFGPESRYLRPGVPHEGSAIKQEYLSFRRIDTSPLSLWEFVQPLFLGRYPYVLIAACAHSMVFLFGSILVTVELPFLFVEKFNLNPEQLGLQFLSVIIGSIIGEQLGGQLSPIWMARQHRKTNGTPEPEFRLWLSYPGFMLVIMGMIVFLVRTQQAAQGHWNITPLVGVTFAACGNQIVTTVLVTYAVDCLTNDEAASVGVFITFVRQIWGFIGPFWIPKMAARVGVGTSAAIVCGLLVSVSMAPVMLAHLCGRRWRAKGPTQVSIMGLRIDRLLGSPAESRSDSS